MNSEPIFLASPSSDNHDADQPNSDESTGSPIVASGFSPISLSSEDAAIGLSVLGTYRGGFFSKSTPAKPPAYDPETQRLFVGSVDRQAIDVLDISNPDAPVKEFEIDLSPFDGEPNSVTLYRSVLAVVSNDPESDQGKSKILFFNTDGDLLVDPIRLDGAGRLAFTPDGQKVGVTVGGDPYLEFDGIFPKITDPEGAVVIIGLGNVDWDACREGPAGCGLNPQLTVADFKAYNGREAELISQGVRIYGPYDPKPAEDLDPAEIAISDDSRFAWVTLTRNNAIAVVDLETAQVVDLFALGYKDHSLAGNGFDASDADGAINIQTWPVRSFYSPDGIAVFTQEDETYLVTANEGDPKDYGDLYSEKVRVKDLDLDDTQFPNADQLQQNEVLGRLFVTNENGDIDGGDTTNDFEELYMLGSRSFSVWTADGDLVFDSGDDFERITAEAAPTLFNASEDSNQFDTRSDDRGPEPEAITVGEVNGSVYAFTGFERIGGLMVYDVTDPAQSEFVQYINNRNVDLDPSDVCGEKEAPETPTCPLVGDLELESLLFISADLSPVDAPLLVASHELSDSTTIFRINTLRPDDMFVEGIDGNNVLVGGAGDDTVHGLGGDDILYGDGGASSLRVSFVGEDAGYQSTYGWYNTETLEAGILVANVDTVTNPGLEDYVAGLPLSPDQLETLGFFLIPDGYRQNGDAGQPFAGGDGTDLDLETFEDGDTWKIRDTDLGYVFEGSGNPAYFTEADRNPAGNDHVMEEGDLLADGTVTHKWEDLPGLGDADFDDVVFDVNLGCGPADAGTPGDDSLMGGAGDDTLAGGEGADTFHYQGTDFGQDQITDFAFAEDKIVFEGVDGADDPDDLTYAVGDFGDGAGDDATQDIRITFASLGDNLLDEQIDILDVGSDIEALKADMLFV